MDDSQTSERKHAAETVEGLYARICEHPDDDGLRAVFADLLTERGDARGEFVTLQLQSQRDLAKENRLIKKHASAFAGPLDGRFDRERRVFERGFLAGGALAGRGHATLEPEELEEPAWRLITTLKLPLGCPTTSLTHPNLTFVRKLEVTEASLPPMLEREWPLTELVIGHWNDDRLALPHPLSEAAQFPALKVLGVHDIPDASAVACRQWLPNAPVLKRLERVVLDISATKFGPWWPDLTKSPIPTVQLGRAPGWVFTFTRDERGELGALNARHDPRNGIAVTSHWKAETISWMKGLLTGLPPDALTNLTIEPSPTSKKLDRAALEQTLTRFPLLSRVMLPFDRSARGSSMRPDTSFENSSLVRRPWGYGTPSTMTRSSSMPVASETRVNVYGRS
ncbi:MAG: TIGR02996 domain-containing protein [Myxococcales bacterium]|nr:TIGR02996 domain-containing protein [Myxococcales bacterium]